jgi:hypothetical protein
MNIVETYFTNELHTTMNSYKQVFENNSNITPLMLISIFFYSGRTINQIKKKYIWDIYRPYISKLFDYITMHYEIFDVNKLRDYMENQLQKNTNMTFRYFLLSIEMHMRDIYVDTIEKEHDEKKYYKYMADMDTIDVQKIFEFIVYYEYRINIAELVSSIYNISKNEILELFENSIKDGRAGIFHNMINHIDEKVNINIYDFIQNICKNMFNTPYKLEDKICESIRDAYAYLESQSSKYTSENYIKTIQIIEHIRNEILEESRKRVSNGDDLYKIYREVCIQYIHKYSLQEFESLLCDIFEPSMSKLVLEFALKSVESTEN